MNRIRRVGSFNLARLLVSAAILVCAYLPSPAQQETESSGRFIDRLCPSIRVKCPETVGSGSRFTFEAVVAAVPRGQEITYTWAVSNARIVAGEGTSLITVEVEPGKYSVHATVNVGGLDRHCHSQNTCSTFWQPAPLARLVDRYKKLKPPREKVRLDRFAAVLRSEPGSTGYIIAYGRSRRGDQTKEYLVEKHGIEPARLVSLKGGHRRDSVVVELYVVPAGANAPEPVPPAKQKSASIVRGAV